MFGLFGKPSKEKFAALVLAEIRQRGGPADFQYVPESFSIKRESTKGFLGDTYDAYCQATRAHRKTILANYAQTFVSMNEVSPASFDEIRPKLVAVVRERALFSMTSLHWQLDEMPHQQKQLNEPISEWFARAIVIDQPSHMTLVNESQVTEWNQLPEEIFITGINHLRESTVPKFIEDRGLFRGCWHDDYDSSRILVPGVFDDLPLRGDPVVVIPNRLTLLVAGSDDHDALRRMLAEAEEIFQTKAKAQNPAPLLMRSGVISDFSVDPTSPIFNEVQRAKRIAALSYYQEQKTQLEKLYEKTEKALFVASYTLHQIDGKYRSCVVWTKDVPTLLPVADDVVFTDTELPEGKRVMAHVPWLRVYAELNDLMLDTQMFPPRYFVSKFPTLAQFQRLNGPPSSD